MKITHISHRPLVLSCAGFDPSAGAGLLGDAQAIHSIGAYAMGVETCATVQNDAEFFGIESRMEYAKQQLLALARRFEFGAIKIGLVPSLKELEDLLLCLRGLWPGAKVIWDPILAASAGYEMSHDLSALDSILQKVDLWTPNLIELHRIYGDDFSAALGLASRHGLLYLKGGHAEGKRVKDAIYSHGAEIWSCELPRTGFPKHGSGCHLSAALAGAISQHSDWAIAAQRSRIHLQALFESDVGLLGFYPSQT